LVVGEIVCLGDSVGECDVLQWPGITRGLLDVVEYLTVDLGQSIDEYYHDPERKSGPTTVKKLIECDGTASLLQLMIKLGCLKWNCI